MENNLNLRTLLKPAAPLINLIRSNLFDPISYINHLRAFPFFVRNLYDYSLKNKDRRFSFKWRDAFFTSYDRFQHAGIAGGHYFFQDLWAASILYKRNVAQHVDVGSRTDGFVAHLLPFCHVTYVDLRKIESNIPNLIIRQGSLLDLPFEDASIESLSCLHVIEHVVLGRYGDGVDPEGYLKAARELSRVLTPGGVLL